MNLRAVTIRIVMLLTASPKASTLKMDLAFPKNHLFVRLLGVMVGLGVGS